MDIRHASINLLQKVGIAAMVFTGFGLALQPLSVSADVNFIHDNFDHLYLKPDARAKWWIINWGGSNGQVSRVEDFCGVAACVQAKNEGGNKFVRLSTFPNAQSSGFFVNAELTELHTGFPSEGQGKWTPRPGHPVILESRVKWSAQYRQNGDGAVGTNGIWLWNSPFDLAHYDPNAIENAIGFNWAEADTVGGLLGGLKVTVLQNNYPIYINRPTRTINMQDWNTFVIIWSEDANHVQTARFFINSEDLGTATLPARMEHLSVETWNDNEDGQISRTGQVQITYRDIPSTQSFDVNEINLAQL